MVFGRTRALRYHNSWSLLVGVARYRVFIQWIAFSVVHITKDLNPAQFCAIVS